MARKRVPDDGPLTARILLVGEAPGEKEVKYGRPFVGPSGKRIGGWWSKVNLYRNDFRITNTVPWRLDATKRVSKEDWQVCVGKLKHKIDHMPNLEIIVPTGALALKAFLPQHKITKVRGTEIPYVDGNGRELTIVPTLHPAATFHRPEAIPVCERDWDKIARLLRGEILERPDLTHYIPKFALGVELPERRCVRDDGAVAELLAAARDPKMVMSIDVENTRGADPQLTCVGFSVEPSWSVVFPTLARDYGGDKFLIDHAWMLIDQLCDSACEKVLQVGWTDLYKLRFLNKIEVRNYKWDLLCMHATLEPLAPHSLAHMASVYTQHPYWKDMTGVNRERDLQYNGIDNCVQREIFDALFRHLREARQLGFYRRHYGDMLCPLFETSAHGISVDTRERKRWHAQLTAEVIEAQDRLEQLAGEPLHAKKSLSQPRVKRFLFETLGLPRQWTRAKRDAPKKLTTDATALKRLRLRHTNKHLDAAEALDLILATQRKSKLTTFLADRVEDSDGRVRCEYSLSNEDFDKGTGRLKSKKNPLGTGMNLQNVDREVRRIFKPDEGCLLVSADLSQAEWRVFAMYSNDPELMELARLSPLEFDVHVYNASLIFRKQESAVTSDERYLAKRGAHAADYGLRGGHLSEILLKDTGEAFTTKYCQDVIDAYLDSTPGPREYQKWVRNKIRNERELVNTWGRKLPFFGPAVSDDQYRQGYAFLPQSDVVDLLNQWGFIPMFHHLHKGIDGAVNLQVHDDVTWSARPDSVWSTIKFLHEQLERPRKYRGNELTIPVSFKIQTAWGVGHEFKIMPTKDEVGDVVRKLRKEL